MKHILLFFTCFCLLRLPEGGFAQQQPSLSVVLDKLPSVKRVAVISPRELCRPDPRILEMEAGLRSLKDTAKSRPKAPIKKENKTRFDALQFGAKPKAPQTPYSDAQLRMFGESVFVSALRALAQERLKAGAPLQEDLQKQMAGAKAEGAEDLRPSALQKIADALDCELILLAMNCSVEVRDSRERVVVFRAQVAAPAYALGGERFIGESRFPIAGTASASRSVLFGEYSKGLPELIAESANLAARRTLHALQHSELPPFLLPNARFALAPSVSRTTADRLLFLSEGRKTLLNDVAMLPADVSEMFPVRIPPLFADSLLEPSVVKRALQELGESAANLWVDSERPNAKLIQALGKRLGADYFLIAHITDLEGYGAIPKPIEGASPSPAQNPNAQDDGIAFQARAVAYGVLVRANDGATLWKDRADSTLSLRRENLNPIRPISERKMLQNSIRFSLAALERSFARYGANFER